MQDKVDTSAVTMDELLNDTDLDKMLQTHDCIKCKIVTFASLRPFVRGVILCQSFFFHRLCQ